MFMCFTKWSSVKNLDLFWKQVFPSTILNVLQHWSKSSVCHNFLFQHAHLHVRFQTAFLPCVLKTTILPLPLKIRHSPNCTLVDYWWPGQDNIILKCGAKMDSKIVRVNGPLQCLSVMSEIFFNLAKLPQKVAVKNGCNILLPLNYFQFEKLPSVQVLISEFAFWWFWFSMRRYVILTKWYQICTVLRLGICLFKCIAKHSRYLITQIHFWQKKTKLAR